MTRPAGLWTMPGLAGAGALRSTVADLFLFVRAQMGFLPPDVPAELAAAIGDDAGWREESAGQA